MNYKSQTVDEKLASKSRDLTCEKEGKLKADKPKPKPREKKAAGAPKEKHITPAAKMKIEKILETSKEMLGKMQNQVDDGEEKNNVPEKLLQAVSLAKVEMNAKISESEHALEHGGMSGTEVLESLKTQMKACKVASDKVAVVSRAMED